MPKARAPLNLPQVQRDATKFVMEYINKTPLGLPNLDEADFTKVMDAVTKSMMQAWAAGYMKRYEEV